MTQESNALRLADAYEATGLRGHIEAAAELRRQHEELRATERQVEILSDELSKCNKANQKLTGEVAALSANALDDYKAIQELLEALKAADELIGMEPFEHVAQEAANAHKNIRSAIAKHSKEQA
jgi:chromosome segregation ATPase